MARYRPSLTVSILAFLGLLLILTWFLFSLLAFKTAANDLYTQKREHARTLLKAFVSLLPDSIPVYPEGFIPPDSQAAQYVQKLSDESVFSRLTLLDKNGKPIFSAGREEIGLYAPFQGFPKTVDWGYIRSDGNGVVQLITVIRNKEIVGTAGLLLSLAPERAQLNRSRQMLIAYFVLDFVLLLGLGSFVLSRIIVNPVNRLLTATQKITDGQYGQCLNLSGSAELAKLAAAFNEMSSALRDKDKQVAQQMAALKQVNSDLEQAREEAIRSERMASIGLLAAGMAHEIGTPLASIMGYAELLAAEQPGNVAIHDYSKRISDDSARIDRIVRGLLDYSRPRSLSDENADIRVVILSTLDLMKQQGAFKNLHLCMDIADDILLARCDRHQLQQVLINLLLNSCDATSAGGTITVGAHLDGDHIRLDVTDNGSGIAVESMKYIFDPFYTSKSPGKGTGLGLAISSKIIEGFGGRIAVSSKVGEGSCFSIWLPEVVV